MKRAIYGAVLRTDWLLTDLDEGGYKTSGVVNLDYSFVWLDRNWYAFGEYFHSGFGVNHQPVDLTKLPKALTERLARGELFTLMQDYTALGTRVEWHPLVTQSLTLITNLHDGSNLVQTQFAYEPTDAQHVDAGYVRNLGGTGKEYGAIELAATGRSVHHRRRVAVVSALDILLVSGVCRNRRYQSMTTDLPAAFTAASCALRASMSCGT